MSPLLGALAPLTPIVACVIAGAALARLGLLPPEVRRGTERLVYFALLPALLVQKLSTAPLSGAGGDVLRMVLPLGAATLTVAAAAMVAVRLARGTWSAGGTLAQAACRGNLAFVALPVVALAAAGDPGPPARAALVLGPMVVLYNVLCVPLLIGVDRAAGWRVALARLGRSLATNPILLACAAGLGLAAMPALPAPAAASIALLGQPAGPLALLCLGAAVTTFPVRERLAGAAAAAALKNAALPLIAVGLAAAIGVAGADLRTVAVFASAPTAVASYVLTTQLRGDGELAAASIALSTLVSVVPLAVAMTL